MKSNVYAVLMAGGKGTRLWPLSTEKHSKSFIRIGNMKPLIEETIKRLSGFIERKNIAVVTSWAQRKYLEKFTKGIPAKNIILEPFGRSTASAVGLAAIGLGGEDIMVVLPTDSLIREKALFKKVMKEAVRFIRENENMLLCVGIKPKGPSTAYGYIKTKVRQKGNVYSIYGFTEKPTEKIALRLVKDPRFLWNTGIFIFKARDILLAMKKHAPLLYRELMRIKKDRKSISGAYARMRNVSIDYQIMEKSKNLYCVRGGFAWGDLGSWTSLETIPGFGGKKDRRGNIIFGRADLIDTRNSIVYNSTEAKIGAVGLKDMIVISTKNGTLVCDKKNAEKVKDLASRAQ